MQIGDNNARRYNKEYLLTDFKCRTHRLHDKYRPKSDKYCDYIEATIIAQGREEMQMYDWFINNTQLSGRLLVQLPPRNNQGDSDMQEILFEEAQCFSLEEEYHINSNQRRMLRLQFVAEQVNINGVIFKRK